MKSNLTFISVQLKWWYNNLFPVQKKVNAQSAQSSQIYIFRDQRANHNKFIPFS